ncbi:serine/threonine-protein kinase [Rivibacter subsaxonicus]|uniref:Serine/threonine protein kinase n=1 Tax=Rivibacter subsaxonicus TaxID=457575 RepID=A0A4Q7VXS7_9BURK|nr:serine/threonine-protein kinase [Rivibacter subsaxonicus]RZU01229.1 serine/threonine protein kinase [Rivibacter subsaxonicus]
MSSLPAVAAPPIGADLPERIGKYRVLRKLGEGATSEVFLGHDDFNDRPVAIKRSRPQALADGSEGSGHQARFFAAEAALVGRLQHPNVVQLYDAVPDPAGPYLVMEYVAGTTLRQYCRADSLLPLDQIVELGFKCAMALGYFSRQGLIHRDIKPANILASLAGGEHLVDVKISDFGSVLNLSADTTQVFRVGSLAYMAPEQLDGDALDTRADIYALGAVLYHLIAGRPPFEAASQPALMTQICTAEPAPLQALRAGVEPALDAVVRRALAKSRNERYADWDQFAKALSALVANQLVPRGNLQAVLDSERFNLLRSLEFFAAFGDVELWEVVHRARWQRFPLGHKLYQLGEEGNTFHIIAEGAVDVFRNGSQVAHLGAGTSVGEMAYLAPNPELRRHSADVVVVEPAATIAFAPDAMARLSPSCRHLFDDAFIRVLVRRLHAAHEAIAHPRRIL